MEKETNDIELEYRQTPDIESSADSSWARDQRERNYYYDDSTGYEIYNPDEDDEDEESE